MLNYNQIKELISDIDKSSLRVFELECSGIKFRLSKNEETNFSKNEEAIESNINSEDKIENTISVTAINEEIENDVISDIDSEKFNVIKSPLVGTFYSSSTPGGEPYVEVGSIVKKGDVLCIVEAMKIMNEITSEYDGEVVEILKEDEDIVEFGTELFKIK